MHTSSRWVKVVLLFAVIALVGCADTAEDGTVEEEALEADVPAAGESIAQIIQENAQMEQLEQLIERAGLTETLQQEGPFTVFAPTDAAFEKMEDEALRGLMQDTERLRDLLLYHVVPEALSLDEVPEMEDETTLQGESLAFGASERGAMVNAANIITPNIEASNGVVHAIDSVLELPMPE